MSIVATPRLAPKLRFPEFRQADAWAERPLKDVAQINPSNDGLPKSFVYVDLESVEAGKLQAKARIQRDGAPSRAQRVLNRGDIIYQVVRPYQRNNLLCEFGDNDDYVASTGYAQLRAKGSNHFLYHSLHTDSFVERVIAKCTGSNYPAINSSDLAEIGLPIPPTVSEEEKISECLSTLDELIGAENQKLDALNAHKKGLMQQLFPREGETLPRFRFPEFREAPEWEETELGQLVHFESGGTPSKQNPSFWSGDVPWVSAKDMKHLFLQNTEDHITAAAIDNGAKQVPAFTVLMLTRGMTLFKDVPICVVRRPMSFNQDVKALRILGDVDPSFLPYLLLANKQRLLQMVDSAGHGTGRLNTDDLKSFRLAYPSADEQMQIANCLGLLEEILPAQVANLEALKKHKHGLMQQLFPCPTEASR